MDINFHNYKDDALLQWRVRIPLRSDAFMPFRALATIFGPMQTPPHRPEGGAPTRTAAATNQRERPPCRSGALAAIVGPMQTPRHRPGGGAPTRTVLSDRCDSQPTRTPPPGAAPSPRFAVAFAPRAALLVSCSPWWLSFHHTRRSELEALLKGEPWSVDKALRLTFRRTPHWTVAKGLTLSDPVWTRRVGVNGIIVSKEDLP
jgi:hypothetical protein